MNDESTLKTASAAKGVLYSFLLKLLSFTLSQVIIRLIDPASLGKASVRLELICNTTVLFLGREGFRLGLMKVACSRAENNNRRFQAVNNVIWLCVPLSLVFSFMAMMFHFHTYYQQVSSSDTDEILDYKWAGAIYCLATMMEILSEPCMIECLRDMDMRTRAKAEAFASIGKALTCVVLLSFQDKKYNATAFSIAQFVYASVWSGTLYVYKRHCLQWPDFKLSFDRSALWLCIIFTFQSIFKHLLTEGDRIVLSAISGAYDAGIYAMASAYCGMVCRLVLQPMEENGRILFSNSHARIVQVRSANKEDAMKLVHELRKTYCLWIKLMVYIGAIFATFGSNYASLLLKILAGDRWASNVDALKALSAYCIYTGSMALNGMTEAFVYGVAETGSDIGRLTAAHALIGLVFYVLAPVLVLNGNRYGIGGTVGLVVANGLCMVLRSMFSLHFAFSYFKGCITGVHQNKMPKMWNGIKFLKNVFPPSSVMVLFLVCFMITSYSQQSFSNDGIPPLISIDTAKHLGLGISCFGAIGGYVYMMERDFSSSLYALIMSKQRKYKQQ